MGKASKISMAVGGEKEGILTCASRMGVRSTLAINKSLPISS